VSIVMSFDTGPFFFSPMFQKIVAIVSGGASGLGAATASYLARHGGRVIVADLAGSREGFIRLKESISGGDDGDGDGGSTAMGSLVFAAADVTSEIEITSALDEAEEAFGEYGTLFAPRPRPRPSSASR
jgi:3-hydroxyacyl-CoA dehydrogenase/3-hydroxy-2-methylbutyryl-CoA dehydrogenase